MSENTTPTVRTSALARSIAKQFGRPIDEVLYFVQAAKAELEISTSLLSEKQAAEVERLVNQAFRAK